MKLLRHGLFYCLLLSGVAYAANTAVSARQVAECCDFADQCEGSSSGWIACCFPCPLQPDCDPGGDASYCRDTHETGGHCPPCPPAE